MTPIDLICREINSIPNKQYKAKADLINRDYIILSYDLSIPKSTSKQTIIDCFKDMDLDKISVYLVEYYKEPKNSGPEFANKSRRYGHIIDLFNPGFSPPFSPPTSSMHYRSCVRATKTMNVVDLMHRDIKTYIYEEKRNLFKTLREQLILQKISYLKDQWLAISENRYFPKSTFKIKINKNSPIESALGIHLPQIHTSTTISPIVNTISF